MAIRFNTKEFAGNTLYLYSYDTASNNYIYLTAIANKTDSPGYLHFNCSMGNTLVITDKPLKLK